MAKATTIMSYAEAKKLVNGAGIKTAREYSVRHQSNGWTGWCDWLNHCYPPTGETKSE